MPQTMPLKMLASGKDGTAINARVCHFRGSAPHSAQRTEDRGQAELMTVLAWDDAIDGER